MLLFFIVLLFFYYLFVKKQFFLSCDSIDNIRLSLIQIICILVKVNLKAKNIIVYLISPSLNLYKSVLHVTYSTFCG